jgi:hypothetical protein
MSRGEASSEGGQATIELIALLPLVLAAILVVAAILAGHAAEEQAGQAAHAGAIAILQGRDAREAARAALPSGTRRRARIEVAGRRVTVRVRPSVPIAAVATAMTADATAEVGWEP